MVKLFLNFKLRRYSEAGIVISLFLIFGDAEHRCSYKKRSVRVVTSPRDVNSTAVRAGRAYRTPQRACTSLSA